MLAIISDLHFTDGSTAVNVSGDAFTEILGPEIVNAVKRKGAKELHLILLGDIYDVVRTDYWVRQPKQNRPWNGTLDKTTAMNPLPAVLSGFEAVLADVFAKTKFFPQMLEQIAKGCPGIPMKVSYVIGNHDRVLNNFPSLKTAIISELGYPVDFVNSLDLPDYAVHARHGHEWDDNCSAYLLLKKVLQRAKTWERLDSTINNTMAIGEVVTAELMGGLVYYVGQKDPDLAAIIKEVNNVRPAESVFSWLEWKTRNKLTKAQQKILADALIDAISGVIDSKLGKLWDDVKDDLIVSGDITDYLEKVRDRLKDDGYAGLKSLILTLTGIRDFFGIEGEDEYLAGAIWQFEENLPATVRYVFYGHTHVARHDFVSGAPDRSQIYINTGTYLPLIQAANENRGYVQAGQMTMAFVYAANEIKTPFPQLDLWNGIRHSDRKA